MSFVQQLAAAASRVVAIPAPNGATLYVRIKRPTAGEAIASGVTALVAPAPTEEEKQIAETVGKRRAAMRSAKDHEALLLATQAAQARILAACVTHVGDSEATLEPVTVLVNEEDAPRAGTEGLPFRALLPEWVNGIAMAIWDGEQPGGWSALTSAAFPAGVAGGHGRDGGGVGSAA